MKIILSVALFIFLAQYSSAQSINTDSLVKEICMTVETEKLATDSLTMINGLLKHINKYSSKLDQPTMNRLLDRCYLRLQRECPEFKNMLSRMFPSKGDWKAVENEPASFVSKEDCIAFFNISRFKYLEQNGDSTLVHITDSSWTDTFLDKTYSRLSLSKKNDCDFLITFISSNNILRKNFSKPGDVYRYKIIQRFDNYYQMYTEIPGSPQKLLFRLYYSKQ